MHESTRHSTHRLDAWESDLQSRLSTVELVGELNLSRDEFERLSRDIRDVVARHGDQRLVGWYPCCLATFLVFCGIFGYEQGNYWNSVTRRLGRDLSTTELGKGFVRALTELRLELFPQFDAQRALPYVSRILAHGGVPDSCLGDFFDLLAYSLGKPDWNSLPVRDLLAEWQARRFAFMQIDVPIQRFLTDGGATARDFVQRSIDMVGPALTSVVPVDSMQTGLPVRIGETFNDWLTRRGASSNGVTSIDVRRMSAPRLSIDPWGSEGLLLYLPRQRVDENTRMASWSIGYGSRTRIINATPSLGSLLSQEAEILIEEPAGRWDVTFVVDGVEQSSWQFMGVTPHRPFLAFDPVSLAIVRSPDVLPSGQLLLLYPIGSVLVTVIHGIERQLEINERFPARWGAWRNFEVVQATIPDHGAVHISNPRVGATAIIPIQTSESVAGRPTSDIDQRRLQTVWASDARLPVVTSAPTITIPVTDESPEIVDRWTIVLAPQEGSLPAERVVRTVGELTWFRGPGAAIVVDLGQPALLGSHAVGTYTVSVRGPLGKDSRFQFALVPGLDVRGQNSHTTINRTHDVAAQIQLRAQSPILVRCLDREVSLLRVQDGIDLIILGHMARLSVSALDVGRWVPEHQTAVDLHVPVAGVRWSVTSGAGTGQLQWSSSPLSLPQEIVLAGEAGVLVEGYSAGSPAERTSGSLRLSLRDADDRDVQRLNLPVNGPRVWVPLHQFATTISSSNDAAMTVSLDIIDTSGAVLVLKRDILRVTRDLVVTDLTLSDSRMQDGQREVQVGWKQPYRVNDRALRLSSVSRPWEAPATVSIPDDVISSFAFTTNDLEVPPGPYRAELIVVDPWVGSAPAGDGSRLFDVRIGSVDEIVARAEQPATTSTELLEQFMLAPRADRLQELSTLLKTENPSPAISVLSAMTVIADDDVLIDESYLEASILELRDALINHSMLLEALAERYSTAADGNAAGAESLPRLVATLGLAQANVNQLRNQTDLVPPVTRALLERELPWLFLTRVGDRLIASDQDRIDAELLLGTESLGRLLPECDLDHVRVCPWNERTDEIVAAFGYAPELMAYRMPVAQFEQTRPMLGLVPGGVIDKDTYVTATFDWLLALNHPRRAARKRSVEAWLQNAVPRIEGVLVHLADDLGSPSWRERGAGIRAALQIVNLRLTPELSGVELLPYTIGGIALMQRALSRTNHSGTLRMSESLLLEYGRFAARTAPGIYLHDLCLFDLLTTLPRSSSDDMTENDDNELEGQDDE